MDENEDWGPHARNFDPDTSHASAESLRPARDIWRVVKFYADHDRPQGWTRYEAGADEERQGELGYKPGFWRRVSDAFGKDLIEYAYNDHGPITRAGGTNRQQHAYRITSTGRKWLGEEGDDGPVGAYVDQ